jgi:CelD/BcsL family acetyltransferase involved in cellulose biosynthesis
MPARAARANACEQPLAVTCEPGFDFASPDYAALHAGSEATAFQHPIWLSAMTRHLLAPRRAEAATIVGRDRIDGSMRFVLPLIRRAKSAVTLIESFDLGVSDYSAPVTAGGFTPDDQTAASVALALPSHDVLRIKPCADVAANLWRSFLEGRTEQLDFSAHASTFEGGFDAWRSQAFVQEMRGQLDRKRKRFFKQQGAALRLLADPDEIRDAVASLRRLRTGRFGGDPIQDAFVHDFYADVAVSGAPSGFARTYALSADGVDVGYTFNLAWKGRLHYLLIGCDYEQFGKHSPGLILYDETMRDWHAAGGEVFDFTIGDEPFKGQFGAVSTPMFQLRAAASWRGRLAMAAHEARDRLRGTKQTA